MLGSWRFLGEDLFRLSLLTILTATGKNGSSVELGGSRYRSRIVFKSLHSCAINMCSGTWMFWLDTLASNMGNGILGITSIVPFSCRRWRWAKAMFSSNRKIPLALETTVTGLARLGFSCISLATLTTAFHAVTRMVSKSSVGAVLLTVFKRGDRIAMGRELWGTSLSLFRRNPNICWLLSSVPNRISTANVSATRNRDLIYKSPIVTVRSSCSKARMGLLALM